MQVSLDTEKECILMYIPCVSRLEKEMIWGNRIWHVISFFPVWFMSYFTFLVVFLRKKQEEKESFLLKMTGLIDVTTQKLYQTANMFCECQF